MGKAQTHTAKYVSMGAGTNGYYEYLPQGYNPAGSQTYPVIIAIHGAGDIGNGSPAELPRLFQSGLPKLINDGNFPSSFTVNNQTFRFIVISPQFTSFLSPPSSVAALSSIMSYVASNYKTNLNRVYMTGLSMGGGFTFNYAGNSTINAQKLAAIVPIAEAAVPDYNQARTIASANLPVWATHNNGDPVVPASQTDQYVTWINEAPSPNPSAKKTIFSSGSHDAWTQTYDPAFKENGLNIYEWMLQFQRNLTVLPVQITNYQAYRSGNSLTTVTWTTTNEINNDHFTIERSSDGTRFNTIGTVQGLNRDHTYTYLDARPLQGDNYYRLSQTDRNGRTTYFEVLKVNNKREAAVTIRPNPVKDVLRIELDSEEKGSFTASIFSASGVLVKQWKLNKQDYGFEESVPVAFLSKGSYVLQLEGVSFKKTQQFIKY